MAISDCVSGVLFELVRKRSEQFTVDPLQWSSVRFQDMPDIFLLSLIVVKDRLQHGGRLLFLS